jgi:hypothetical protein
VWRVEGFEVGVAERTLAAAWARFGRLELGAPIEGDGNATTTWALATERGGEATLRLALDPASGAVAECALLVARRLPPDESW